MDAVLNFLQGHQEFAWLLVITLSGSFFFAAVGWFTVTRQSKDLTEVSVERQQLRDEVDYLIQTHRYIEPVTVDVKSLAGIEWQELLEQGSRSNDVAAAVRVQNKIAARHDYHGVPNILYLDPQELAEANITHKKFLAVIDGAIKQTEQSA